MTLNLEQFAPYMDERGAIHGEHARQLMRSVNVRTWPIDMPAMFRDVRPARGEGPVVEIDPDETLHTAQSHLHLPTLEKYVRGEVPEHDPDFEDEEGVPYLPEVLTGAREERWINEGHHRIVAARLRGEDVPAWEGRIYGR